MNLAGRPTGITVAILVFVALFLSTSIIPVIWLIPGIVMQAIAAAESGAASAAVPVAVGQFNGIDGLVTLFSFGTALLLLWWWVRGKERRGFATLGFETSGSRSILVARGLLLGLGMIAAAVLLPVLLGQARIEWNSPSGGNLAIIGVMLLGFLVQGSTEEILNRGFLTQAVARRWGLVTAVGVQSLCFALLHGANPGIGVLPFINLVLFALFASLMSLAEGSLWGVCALHGAWNWAQGNLFGVAVSGNTLEDSLFAYHRQPGSSDLLTGGSFGIEGSLATTLVFLVGAFVSWRLFLRRTAR